MESNKQLTQNVETISAKFENATIFLSDALFHLNAKLDVSASAPSRGGRVKLKLKHKIEEQTKVEERVEESTPTSAK